MGNSFKRGPLESLADHFSRNSTTNPGPLERFASRFDRDSFGNRMSQGPLSTRVMHPLQFPQETDDGDS
jgi:hypothetical protein